MRAYIYILLPLLAALSCSEGNSIKEAPLSNLDEFKTYAIEAERKEVSAFSLMDEVEVMRLEETDESLLGSVMWLGNTGKEFVIPNGMTSDILVFSNKGRFLRKFNHRGGGPEEYSDFRNIWMQENELGIFDGEKIVNYNLRGSYLSSQKIGMDFSHLYPYEGGYALDMNERLTEDSLQFNVVLVDSEMKTKAKLSPFLHLPPFRMRWAVNSFEPYKEGLAYHPVFNDTVFMLHDSKLKPLFNIELGAKWLWKDESLWQNAAKARAGLGNPDKIWAFLPYVSEQHILIYERVTNTYALIDRISGEYEKIHFQKMDGKPFPVTPILWEKEQMLFSLPGPEVSEFLERINEDQWDLKSGTTLEEIESSENPVLMWVKFKGF